MAGSSDFEGDILNLDVDRCRLGSLEVPQWFLNLVSPVVISQLRDDRLLKPFLDAAKAVAMTVVDLLADPATLAKVKEEFQQGK